MDIRKHFEHFKDQLRERAIRMTGGNHALADDLVQEVFLRLLLKNHQIKDEACLKGWLRTTLNRCYVQHLRQSSRHNKALAKLAAHSPHDVICLTSTEKTSQSDPRPPLPFAEHILFDIRNAMSAKMREFYSTFTQSGCDIRTYAKMHGIDADDCRSKKQWLMNWLRHTHHFFQVHEPLAVAFIDTDYTFSKLIECQAHVFQAIKHLPAPYDDCLDTCFTRVRTFYVSRDDPVRLHELPLIDLASYFRAIDYGLRSTPVKSLMELLNAAYALLPAQGEVVLKSHRVTYLRYLCSTVWVGLQRLSTSEVYPELHARVSRNRNQMTATQLRTKTRKYVCRQIVDIATRLGVEGITEPPWLR